MNRRSLLLGGVVASVAGILGVKAQAAKPDYPSWIQVDPQSIYPVWHGVSLDKVTEVQGGYQVNQLVPHGTPSWGAASSADIVPLMWADEIMSTLNKPSLFRSPARMASAYRHSINPDLSDLVADDSEDTDDYDFWDS